MTTVIQRNFAAGELAPALNSRVDTTKYATGAKTVRNLLVKRHGGLDNRPGGEYVCEGKYPSRQIRKIPFIFSSDQTYVLEFGHLYVRILQDGARVNYDAEKDISAITNANPGVITSTAHGLSDGDYVEISAIVGPIGDYLNNRDFIVANVTTDTFTLQYTHDASDVNTASFGLYTSGGKIQKIFEIESPYVESDLSTLEYAQSADVITIAHQNYPVYELNRLGSDPFWTLSEVTFEPSITYPSNLTVSVTSGTAAFWAVTSVKEETFEESIAFNIVGAATTPNSGSPITVGWDAVDGAEEYNVYRRQNGVFGFIGVAGNGAVLFVDNGIVPDTSDTPPKRRDIFELEDLIPILDITLGPDQVDVEVDPMVLSDSGYDLVDGDIVFVSSIAGTTELNDLYFGVRQISSGVYRLTDREGVDIDGSTLTAYSSAGWIQGIKNFPATVNYIQQRLSFGNTKLSPEGVWMSRTGKYKNFTVSNPIQSDDAVTFSLAGRQVNFIRHLLELGKPIINTTAGEWSLGGDQNGAVTPTSINPKQHSYNGSDTIIPIVADGNAIYVQARGSIVRDFNFDYEIDGYRGNDLTIFSSHLLDSLEIVDWCYQQVPNSIIWAARSDGVLLGLTYVKEQQIIGWHRHDFSGDVEGVCSIPEGSEDAVYVTVKRTIDGVLKRQIERLSSRNISDILDANFMDSSLMYDGRHTGPVTMTLSGSGWTSGDLLTLTASGAVFSAGDVGNAVHLTGSDGTLIRFTITGYTSATVVTGQPNKNVPASMQATAISTWALAVDQVGGLWHLEGKSVSVFADGFVVASPNNDAYTVLTVTNGKITLDRPYAVIRVGLPYLSDLETLNIDTAGSETISDKKNLVTEVTLNVEGSRGIWVGGSPPTDDDTDPQENLNEAKIRNDENYDEPVDPLTGTVKVLIKPEWNSNGRVFIRQIDPVPLSILSVAPSGVFAFRRRANG